MYRQALQLAPDDYQIWGALGDSYRALDGDSVQARRHYAQAVSLAEEVLRIDPGSNRVLALLAHFHAAMDQAAAARSLIDRALAAGAPDLYVHYDVALAHALLGDVPAAVQQLELALEAGYPPDLLEVEPAFDALQGELTYQELIKAPRAGG